VDLVQLDLTTAAAILAMLIGSAGLGGLIKVLIDGRHAAKQHDLDVLREVVDQLQEENGRLCERVEAYERIIYELRTKAREQDVQIEDLKRKDRDNERQIDVLRRELGKAQHHIADLVVENEKLKKQVNGGRV